MMIITFPHRTTRSVMIFLGCGFGSDFLMIPLKKQEKMEKIVQKSLFKSL